MRDTMAKTSVSCKYHRKSESCFCRYSCLDRFFVLGLALGFPERFADVRIAQYESGTRTPKDDRIAKMATIEIDEELCIRLNRQRPDYVDLLEMTEDWYTAWNHDQDDPSSPDEYTDQKLNYLYLMKRRK